MFLKYWVAGYDVDGVEVPQPVREDHSEGEREEEDERCGVEGEAPVQQTEHRHSQQQTQADVQVPAHGGMRKFS